jgi:hypothetical protein
VQPVLYPNAHMQSVGKEVAAQDIEVCRQLAEAAGAEEGSGKAGRVATGTAVGAGVGAASGAVGGAIFGAGRQGLDDRRGERSGVGAANGPILYRRRPLPTKSGLFEFRGLLSAREGV